MENKCSFMQTLYSSICIFHSDLFSEGLTETPEGPISLSARSPPFLFRVMSYKNDNKTGVSSLRACWESQQLIMPKNREKLARLILSGLDEVGGAYKGLICWESLQNVQLVLWW